MTQRERMLAAYRRQQPDQVPASPELWYDVSHTIDKDCTWKDICFGRYPLWKAQLAAHRYFGTAAWLIEGPKGGTIDGEITTRHEYTPDGDLEFHHVGKSSKGTLEWRVRNNASFYDWMSEHPIKDIDRDLGAFELLFLRDPETLDLSEISAALEGVGEDGIVTAYAGALFFNFVASNLEGGVTSAILAMLEKESLFEEFQRRYISWVVEVSGRILTECGPEILILENGYSTSGIISPAMYEKWDLPVIRAVSQVVHQKGKLLHLHQHGKCLALMDLIVSGDIDLVEPFERPPSGDTPDLRPIKEKYGHRIAIRGNLHAHETLLRGTPDDVEQEARECIEAAARDGGFILASGDGVIAGTPHENIFGMVEAAEKYGKYQSPVFQARTGK